MNILKIILLFFFVVLFVPQPVQASGGCSGSYGGYTYTGSQSCAKIAIDKKVQKPGTKEYVDGLSVIDPKYKVGQEVIYQIIVTNSGPNKLEKIVVTDTLPQYVTFVSGPGSYDKDTNKLSYVIGVLESGKSDTVYIKTKIADTVSFSEKGYICVTNYVNVKENGGASAEDSTQFCLERQLQVEKPVLGAKETPATGPEAAVLPILLSMAGAGMYLRKKVQI